MTKISSRYTSARSGSVSRSTRAADSASRVKVARIVIASRAVNSPVRTFDAVWMTCSTATRTTRHYERRLAYGQTNPTPGGAASAHTRSSTDDPRPAVLYAKIPGLGCGLPSDDECPLVGARSSSEKTPCSFVRAEPDEGITMVALDEVVERITDAVRHVDADGGPSRVLVAVSGSSRRSLRRRRRTRPMAYLVATP